MKRSVIILLLLTLIGAFALQFVTLGEWRLKDEPVPLSTVLPAAHPGWQVEDLPLGETESLQERSLDILNLDDYLVRRYSQGGTQLTVYLAYWSPGKMDSRLVSVHTPDFCWTENGWTCDVQEDRPFVSAGEVKLRPVEYREFLVGGHREYVYFWHLVGDSLQEYGTGVNRLQSPMTFLKGVARQLMEGRPEQYFIRVNSNRPLSEFESLSLFQDIAAGLAELGLELAEQGNS